MCSARKNVDWNKLGALLSVVVADIAFKVAVMAKITFAVSEITFKVPMITSSMVKITFVVTEITF